jgi:hypothetical protein
MTLFEGNKRMEMKLLHQRIAALFLLSASASGCFQSSINHVEVVEENSALTSTSHGILVGSLAPVSFPFVVHSTNYPVNSVSTAAAATGLIAGKAAVSVDTVAVMPIPSQFYSLPNKDILMLLNAKLANSYDDLLKLYTNAVAAQKDPSTIVDLKVQFRINAEFDDGLVVGISAPLYRFFAGHRIIVERKGQEAAGYVGNSEIYVGANTKANSATINGTDYIDIFNFKDSTELIKVGTNSFIGFFGNINGTIDQRVYSLTLDPINHAYYLNLLVAQLPKFDQSIASLKYDLASPAFVSAYASSVALNDVLIYGMDAKTNVARIYVLAHINFITKELKVPCGDLAKASLLAEGFQCIGSTSVVSAASDTAIAPPRRN